MGFSPLIVDLKGRQLDLSTNAMEQENGWEFDGRGRGDVRQPIDSELAAVKVDKTRSSSGTFAVSV